MSTSKKEGKKGRKEGRITISGVQVSQRDEKTGPDEPQKVSPPGFLRKQTESRLRVHQKARNSMKKIERCMPGDLHRDDERRNVILVGWSTRCLLFLHHSIHAGFPFLFSFSFNKHIQQCIYSEASPFFSRISFPSTGPTPIYITLLAVIFFCPIEKYINQLFKIF